VTFGLRANLSGATFGEEANLSGATFRDRAFLNGVIFGNRTNLSGVAFGDEANLNGVTFGNAANLSGATFHGNIHLRAVSIGEREKRVSKETWPKQRKQKFLATMKALGPHRGPEGFGYFILARACFGGIVNFSGRNFSRRCDLTGAQFSQPPRFDDCKGTSNIDLYGATIQFSGRQRIPGWTTESDVAIRFRALRKLADETKNHDLERDLYIEERKAERGIVLAQYWPKKRNGTPEEPTNPSKEPTNVTKVKNARTLLDEFARLSTRLFDSPFMKVIASLKDRTDWRRVPKVLIKPRFLAHCLWIALMAFYWLLSDYGRSFVRPMLALLLSVVAFYWIYIGVLEAPKAEYVPDFKNAVRAYVIANAVPFVGALTLEKEVKTTLLCGGRADVAVPGGTSVCTPVPPPSLAFQLIAIGQSIFSAICVFFAGLALRNYFKLR
jgi:uncharacterized protein YjbI with pentapeptide repeats